MTAFTTLNSAILLCDQNDDCLVNAIQEIGSSINLLTISTKFAVTLIVKSDLKTLCWAFNHEIEQKLDNIWRNIDLGLAAPIVRIDCSLSDDGANLAVITHSNAQGSELSYFSVEAILTNAKATSFISIHLGYGRLTAFSWSPTMLIFACGCSDSSMTVAQIGNGIEPSSMKTIVGSKKFPNSLIPTAVSWSPKGKQLIVGRSDGIIQQFKPDMQETKMYPAPNANDINAQSSDVEVVVASLCWLSTFQIAALYLQKTSNAPIFTILTIVKGQPRPIFDPVHNPDCCYSQPGEGLNPTRYFIEHIPQLDRLICVSTTSTEVALFVSTAVPDKQPQWACLELDETQRACMPLSAKDQDTYPLGIAFNYSAINLNDTFPRLVILGTDYKVNVFQLSHQSTTNVMKASVKVPNALQPTPLKPNIEPIKESKPKSTVIQTNIKPPIDENKDNPSKEQLVGEINQLRSMLLQNRTLFSSHEEQLRRQRSDRARLVESTHASHQEVERLSSNVKSIGQHAAQQQMALEQARIALHMAESMLGQCQQHIAPDAQRQRPLDPYVKRRIELITKALGELELQTSKVKKRLSDFKKEQNEFECTATARDLKIVRDTLVNVDDELNRRIRRSMSRQTTPARSLDPGSPGKNVSPLNDSLMGYKCESSPIVPTIINKSTNHAPISNSANDEVVRIRLPNSVTLPGASQIDDSDEFVVALNRSVGMMKSPTKTDSTQTDLAQSSTNESPRSHVFIGSPPAPQLLKPFITKPAPKTTLTTTPKNVMTKPAVAPTNIETTRLLQSNTIPASIPTADKLISNPLLKKQHDKSLFGLNAAQLKPESTIQANSTVSPTNTILTSSDVTSKTDLRNSPKNEMKSTPATTTSSTSESYTMGKPHFSSPNAKDIFNGASTTETQDSKTKEIIEKKEEQQQKPVKEKPSTLTTLLSAGIKQPISAPANKSVDDGMEEESDSTQPSAATFNFKVDSSITTTLSSTVNKPSIFGAAEQAATGGNIFGTATSVKTKPASVGLFGSAISSNTTSGVFGQQPVATSSSGGFGSLGLGGTPNPANANRNVFGAVTAPAQSGSSLFAKVSASQPQQQSGGIFGKDTTAPSATFGSFLTGSSTTGGFGQQAVFGGAAGFGQPSSFGMNTTSSTQGGFASFASKPSATFGSFNTGNQQPATTSLFGSAPSTGGFGALSTNKPRPAAPQNSAFMQFRG